MDSVLTFLLAGGRGQRLEPLTRERPKPAIPAGGIYKLIDFTLSNCLNSGLGDVYVLVQHLSAELIRHLHEGWRLYFSATRGENLQAIPPQYADEEAGYAGTADALFQNLNLIAQKGQRSVGIVLAIGSPSR
jgi:glucose-1-phosphate adenylyltransferase